MIAGADAGVVATSGVDGQAAALLEGWADLIAAAFVRETAGGGGFAIGPYVSGNSVRGLRTYAMDASPLNYSNLRGWDGAGAGSAVDDGEVWAATLDEVRRALVAQQGSSGSSRFLELVFDSLAGLPSDLTMIEARDELLGQASADERATIWRAFARRGLGERALGAVGSAQPRPSFETPREANETTVRFRLRAADEGGKAVRGRVFVGQYEAGTTPVADTVRSTNTPASVHFVPGRYAFAFQAAGFGLVRKTLTLPAGQSRIVTVSLPTNRASRAKGAAATGPGAGLSALLDDTEATNWTATDSEPVDGDSLAVTVNLAGSRAVTVDRIGISAALSGAENRFTALRSFTVLACVATSGRNCSAPSHFVALGGERELFTAGAPWPTARDLAFRTIDVPNTKATHLRLVVNGNQCTDGEAYRGSLEQDLDHEADCVLGAPEVARTVRAAELQVFSRPPSVRNSAAS